MQLMSQVGLEFPNHALHMILTCCQERVLEVLVGIAQERLSKMLLKTAAPERQSGSFCEIVIGYETGPSDVEESGKSPKYPKNQNQKSWRKSLQSPNRCHLNQSEISPQSPVRLSLQNDGNSLQCLEKIGTKQASLAT